MNQQQFHTATTQSQTKFTGPLPITVTNKTNNKDYHTLLFKQAWFPFFKDADTKNKPKNFWNTHHQIKDEIKSYGCYCEMKAPKNEEILKQLIGRNGYFFIR